MKIFHVITQMEAGGAQGAAVRNSRHFREKGLDSAVVFLYKKRGVYHGDDIITLLNFQPTRIYHYFIILKNLFLLFRKYPDVKVICYTHYANVLGSIVGYFAGVRGVIVSHRNPVETYPRICRYLDWILGCTPIYFRAICVSKTVLNSFSRYPKLYSKKLKLIYNGIDFEKYSEIIENNKFQRFKDLAPSQYVLITTGRLHPQKNHQVLLEAMKYVNDCILIIAGDGELRADFESVIKNNNLENRVLLIGEIAPEEVKEFLKIGDAFLFPSNYEAFGFSVVEAMASGLPVICSDIPAMSEIVGDAGILLDRNAVEDWTTALNSLNDNKLSSMSKLSLARSKRYSVTVMAEKYLEVLLEYNRNYK